MKHRQLMKKILKEKIHRMNTLNKVIKNKEHPLHDLDMEKEYELIKQKKSNLPRATRNLITYLIENKEAKDGTMDS